MFKGLKDYGLWVMVVLALLVLSMFTTPAQAREVTLTWDANSEPDLAGYNVYMSTESGNYNEAVNEELITDTTYQTDIPDEGVFYFVVTAVDTSTLESDYSSEVSTEGYEEPPDYLYLPPAAPGQNKILSVFRNFPDGTTIEIVEPGKAIVTLPNGMIIEIVGTVATVTQPPG